MRLHVELTSRCVLACPGCPRTQWRDLLNRPVDKIDLNFRDLDRFLDCPTGRQIQEFTLCGDYGDSIYYPELFDFLEWFRSNKSYSLVTNGSYRDKEFWNRLAEIFEEKDSITFSVDGLAHNNHQYRINSNWDSIMLGLDIMSRSKAKVIWKTIVFRYNYKDLAEIKKIAIDKGCEFIAEKTHRFGREDLMPTENLIELNHLYQDCFNDDHSIEIEPRCMQEKTVSCDGFLYPCDWIRNPRTLYKSLLWKQQDRWLSKLKIKNTNYDAACQVVKDWSDWVRESSLAQRPTVDVLCRMKCRKGCQQNNLIEV